METVKYIVIPIIGAIIGLCTNWLAVKMLFRPLKVKRIGKMRIPFTPGLIPKSKPRLAKAIAEAVGESLLTKKDLSEKLLSDELTDSIADNISSKIKVMIGNGKTVCDLLTEFVGTEQYEKAKNSIVEFLSEKVQNALSNADFGELIAKKSSETLIDKTKGTFLAMLINDQTVSMISGLLSDGINGYINKESGSKVDSMINNVLNETEQTPVEKIIGLTDDEKLKTAVKDIYRNILGGNVESLIEKLDLKKIVEDKVNAMDVKELEKLVLSVMKKELNAIIWLGALLGLLIGLINLLFI